MGGQLAFQNMVKPLLKPITFNDSNMASIWRPHPGESDPRHQNSQIN